jgi:hypothetical protein
MMMMMMTENELDGVFIIFRGLNKKNYRKETKLSLHIYTEHLSCHSPQSEDYRNL